MRASVAMRSTGTASKPRSAKSRSAIDSSSELIISERFVLSRVANDRFAASSTPANLLCDGGRGRGVVKLGGVRLAQEAAFDGPLPGVIRLRNEVVVVRVETRNLARAEHFSGSEETAEFPDR